MKQVKDLDTSYHLIQQDREVRETQENIGMKKGFFNYVFIKLDKSNTDYQEIFGSNSCDLDAYVFKIYTTKFNQGETN